MPRTASGAVASGTTTTSLKDEQETLIIERSCFVELKDVNGAVIFWPALVFDNFGVMKAFLSDRGLLDKPLHASIASQFVRVSRLMGNRAAEDQVTLLLGSKNPTGNRLVFAPTTVLDFYEHFGDAVEEAKENSYLKEAIDIIGSMITGDDDVASPSAGCHEESNDDRRTQSVETKSSMKRPATTKKNSKAASRKRAVSVVRKKKTAPSKHKVPKPSTQKVARSKSVNKAKKKGKGGNVVAKTTSRSSPKTVANSSPVTVIMPATIPTLSDVRPLLRKTGCNIRHRSFILPGVDPSQDKYVLDRDYFENGSRMRRYLCAYGIVINGHELDDKEKKLLSLWVRTAIVPGLWGLKGEVPQELRYFLRPAQVHTLLMDLSFKYRGDGRYYLPGQKPRVVGGISLNGRMMEGEDGLRVYLSRFGLPRTCTFNNVTDEDRLLLEYHISQASGVDTYTRLEPQESDPPIFCVDDSNVPTVESTQEGNEPSGSGEVATAEEPNANILLQTQNGSPASCRSVSDTTLISNSASAEKDTQAVAEEECSDEEFRPADGCSTAISEQDHAERQATEKDSRQEAVPYTQPDCDSNAKSDETSLSLDGDSVQNCDTKDTKSTTEIIGQRDGMSSPLSKARLFSETPDKRTSSASDAEEKDVNQANSEEALSCVGSEAKARAKTDATTIFAPEEHGAAVSGQAKALSEKEQESSVINRTRFLELDDDNDSSIYWPAILFENFAVMKAFLESRGLFDQAMFAATTREYTFRVIRSMNGSAVADRVALLLGSRNPTGKRCVFAPTTGFDFYEYIEDAVDDANHNPDLKEALDTLEAWMTTDEVPGGASSSKAIVASDDDTEEVVGQTGSAEASEHSIASREEESPTTPKGKSGQSSYPKASRTEESTSNEPQSAAASESVSVEASDQSLASTEVDTPEQPKGGRGNSLQPLACSKEVGCSDDKSVSTETSSVEASEKPILSKDSTTKAPKTVDASESLSIEASDQSQSPTGSDCVMKMIDDLPQITPTKATAKMSGSKRPLSSVEDIDKSCSLKQCSDGTSDAERMVSHASGSSVRSAEV